MIEPKLQWIYLDSLHDGIKFRYSTLYYRNQSIMLNRVLDVIGKFGQDQNATAASWAWRHVETATTLFGMLASVKC